MSTEITLEELMDMPEDKRRMLLMSSFSHVFPDVQRLIVKLSILPPSAITDSDTTVLLHALYLATMEYSRYVSTLIPEGEPIH